MLEGHEFRRSLCKDRDISATQCDTYVHGDDGVCTSCNAVEYKENTCTGRVFGKHVCQRPSRTESSDIAGCTRCVAKSQDTETHTKGAPLRDDIEESKIIG